MMIPHLLASASFFAHVPLSILSLLAAFVFSCLDERPNGFVYVSEGERGEKKENAFFFSFQ